MEWISVKDRLPENGEDVLVYHAEDFHITVGYFEFAAYWFGDIEKYQVGGWKSCYYCGGSSYVSFLTKNYTTKIITHWMPLPVPPKE